MASKSADAFGALIGHSYPIVYENVFVTRINGVL